MPIDMIGLIKPKNGGAFPIAEDTDVKGGFQVCASSAVRDAIPALNRKQGMLVKTLDTGTLWELAADLVTWILVPSPGASALTQTNWYISFLTGNNTNTGITIGSPLKTFAELFRRWGSLGPIFTIPTVTINVIDHDITDAITGQFNCFGASTVIYIQPTVIPVSRTGTLTGVTAKNTATNVPPKVKDGVLSWTPATRIRLTSGTYIGATAWISKNEGSGVGRTTDFILTATDPYTALTPTIGDTYVVELLPILYVSDINVSGVGVSAQIDVGSVPGVHIKNMKVSGPGLYGQLSIGGNLGLTLQDSKWSGSDTPLVGYDSLLTHYNAYIEGLEILVTRSSFISYAGGGLGIGNGNALLASTSSECRINNFIGQNYAFVFAEGATGIGPSIGNFDAVGSSLNQAGDAMIIGDGYGGGQGENGSFTLIPDVASSLLWGSGNAGVGLRLGTGGSFTYYNAALIPSATGTVGNFAMGYNSDDLVGVYYDDTTRIQSQPISCTWANLAAAQPAGFGGTCHNPRYNNHINIRVGSLGTGEPGLFPVRYDHSLFGATAGQQVLSDIYVATTSATTATQTIATIPMRDNAVNMANFSIMAKSGVNWISFNMSQSWLANSGTLTVAVEADGNTDFRHGGTGVTVAPLLTISGLNILVQVTPWTATSTNWMIVDQKSQRS